MNGAVHVDGAFSTLHPDVAAWCDAHLGTAATDRAERLSTGEAPDFRLRDLNGVEHSLSEQRGRKVLLVVYASW